MCERLIGSTYPAYPFLATCSGLLAVAPGAPGSPYRSRCASPLTAREPAPSPPACGRRNSGLTSSTPSQNQGCLATGRTGPKSNVCGAGSAGYCSVPPSFTVLVSWVDTGTWTWCTHAEAPAHVQQPGKRRTEKVLPKCPWLDSAVLVCVL